MAAIARMIDGTVYDKSGEEVYFHDEKYKGKIFGFYFCMTDDPPDWELPEILLEFYNKYHEEKNFEIIAFVYESDQDEFDKFVSPMPWLHLEFGQKRLIEEIKDEIWIDPFPSFVLIDGDSGEIICRNGREQLESKDRQGQFFPWKSTSFFNRCILS